LSVALQPDLSEFDSDRGPKRPDRCIAGRVIDSLGPQDRVNVQAALENPEYTSASILRYLRKRERAVSDCMLRRHRNGDCCCV
jgi:hypothetical protein